MSMPLSTDYLDDKAVIIIGGGWSGLACAVSLARQGIKVHLLESARQPGGRARRVQFKNFLPHQNLDNGQHIMLGAYHSTLSLFEMLDLHEEDILQRQALELNLFAPEQSQIKLKAPALPAPFHLLAAFSRLQGFTLYERISVIKMSFMLMLSQYRLKQDISVSNLLRQHHQSDKVIKTLWQPLCLATMNTPIHYASAQVFLKVLKDSFGSKRKDSDLLFFKNDLSQLFCEPALDYIRQHNGQVDCASKVTQLGIKQSSNTSEYHFIVTTAEACYQSDTVVVATPAHISDKLLHSLDNQSALQINSFLKPESASLNYYYEPICTVYLQYPLSTKLPSRMIGLYDTIGQWAIDRSLCRQAGLIAVVISGPGKHSQLSHKQLAETIHNELCRCMPGIPEWLDFRVTTEQRATFSCRVNIEQQRPENNTLVPGLFLAGDYTSTHYPSTLEGAIKSGINAARLIINKKYAKG